MFSWFVIGGYINENTVDNLSKSKVILMWTLREQVNQH